MDADEFAREQDQSEFVRYDVFLPATGGGLPECLSAISTFLPLHVWNNEAFVLHDHTHTRCPWAPPPGTDSIPKGSKWLWGQIAHRGSSDDEFFTTFLLSCITTAISGAVARTSSDSGEYILSEVAELLPSWIDSSRYGTVDEIAENRIFIYQGNLHILPIKSRSSRSFPRPLTLSTALAALADPSITTSASARIQEHLLEHRMSHFPEAARRSTHRARVLLPAHAASAFLSDPQLVAHATHAFIERTPDDMRAAAAHEHFPQSDQVSCTLRMCRSHFAALRETPFTIPPGWSMPSQGLAGGGAGVMRAAELGFRLCFGLEMYVSQLGVSLGSTMPSIDPFQTEEWRRFLRSLVNLGYFGGNIEGSAMYKELMIQAKASFLDSAPSCSADSRQDKQAARMTQLLRSPILHVEIERSTHLAEDSSEWMDMDLNEKIAQYTASERKSTQAESHVEPTPCDTCTTQHTDDSKALDGEEIASKLNKFINRRSGVGGAVVDANPCDVDANKIQKLLETIVGPIRFSSHVEVEIDSEATVSDSDSESTVTDAGSDVTDASDDTEVGLDHVKGGKSTFMGEYMEELDRQVEAKGVRGGDTRKDGGKDGENVPVNLDMAAVQDLIESATQSDGYVGPADGLLGMMGLHIPASSGSRQG